ncbi:MAG: pyridoxamine 5'-phosphate oxidase [Bacteroidales bacterium]|jgi:pyridoxamine 5'-phosphate oxidase|nr:pyridoxamine 5'-phosphate oxidase [Bacteroidales bacterium]
MKNLGNIRQDYDKYHLDISKLSKNPFDLFKLWMEDAETNQIPDYNAMVLTSSDDNNQPNARVVLLRELTENGLIFFTNYKSRKGQEIAMNSKVHVLFFWSDLQRQIRIEAIAEKSSKEISDAYFASRPRESQLSSWASMQSQELESPEVLRNTLKAIEAKFKDREVPRPEFWGGYLLKPKRWEFWQGQTARLHQRVVYENKNQPWNRQLLYP